MLGKTAGGLFWMFRYLERSEKAISLLNTGSRITKSRSGSAESEWASLLSTAGVRDSYDQRHDEIKAPQVIDFLLRDRNNPSSVRSVVEDARTNARLVRTALSRPIWEATNEYWLALQNLLARAVTVRQLPAVLQEISRHHALVGAALHDTMLRNDIYNFARLGTFVERADSTARILDVKYYVLLPSSANIGSSLDNVQWEVILRSVGSLRAYRWLYGGDISPSSIADFLILDRRVPRSLTFCAAKMVENLGHLASAYGGDWPCQQSGRRLLAKLEASTIDTIMDFGLHEFLGEFIRDNNALSVQIEKDFRFYE